MRDCVVVLNVTCPVVLRVSVLLLLGGGAGLETVGGDIWERKIGQIVGVSSVPFLLSTSSPAQSYRE